MRNAHLWRRIHPVPATDFECPQAVIRLIALPKCQENRQMNVGSNQPDRETGGDTNTEITFHGPMIGQGFAVLIPAASSSE